MVKRFIVDIPDDIIDVMLSGDEQLHLFPEEPCSILKKCLECGLLPYSPRRWDGVEEIEVRKEM